MSMSGRNNLAVNGLSYDAPFLGSKRLIQYRHPETYENNVIEQIDYSPVNNSNTWGWGKTFKFEIDRRADYGGELEFIVTRSADTLAPNSPASFLDFEGYQNIDYIEVGFDNIPPLRYYGEHIFFDLIQEAPYIERHIGADVTSGYLYPAERVALANVINTTCTKLRLPFTQLDRQIPMHTFSGKMKVEITMKKLADCCKNSSSSTFTLSNPILRLQGMHLEKDSKQEDYKMIYSEHGMPIKIKDREIHIKEQITATAGIQRIKLTNIKNAVYNLKFYLRNQADLNVNAQLTTTNFQACSSFWLEENHQRITPVFEMNETNLSIPDYSVTVNNHRIYPSGQKGLQIACIPMCKAELVTASDRDCYGHRNFNGYNNLELVLNYNTAPSQPQYCDVIGEVHQFMIWENGQLRPYVK